MVPIYEAGEHDGQLYLAMRFVDGSDMRTLKLIAPELAEDEQFRRRFLKEPKLAASLDHPNVVPIYEAGEHEGQLYLAMRYVEGSDMRTLLRRDGGLPLERALAILAQVASALDAAHRRGLVHRDVKPANVLVDEDGHAYLTDFGVTKQLGGDATETGQLVGTLDYIAPEQIRGEAVDGRADVYALGCVLYECFAGSAPFHRATEAETLWAHMQEPVPPRARAPGAGPGAAQSARQGARATDTGRCAELIEAARAALAGVRRRRRRPRAAPACVLAAGLLALAADRGRDVVLGAAATARGGAPRGTASPRSRPTASEIASFIGPPTRRRATSPSARAPSGCSTPRTRPCRASTPTTGEVTGTVRAARAYRPTSRPAGARCGSATAAGCDGNCTRSVSRVDPETGEVTRTVELPGLDAARCDGRRSTRGFPMIAVGDGAVWAINPDQTISRIDPATGRLVAEGRLRRAAPGSRRATRACGCSRLGTR